MHLNTENKQTHSLVLTFWNKIRVLIQKIFQATNTTRYKLYLIKIKKNMRNCKKKKNFDDKTWGCAFDGSLVASHKYLVHNLAYFSKCTFENLSGYRSDNIPNKFNIPPRTVPETLFIYFYFL